MERNPLRMNDFSFNTGLEGMCWYLLSRFFSGKMKSFGTEYVNDFHKACNNVTKEKRIEGIQLFIDYMNQIKTTEPFSFVLNKMMLLPEGLQEQDFAWENGLKIILP